MANSLNKKAMEVMMKGKQNERIFIAEHSFSCFFTYYFLDYVKYPYADFHFDMFKDLDDLMSEELRELGWIAFRESAKTSIAKGFITWLLTFKKRSYINVDSFDKENAERFLFDIVLGLQINQKFKYDFGELFNAKKNPEEITQKRVNNFVANNGVRVEAHSTQESVRGRLHGHQRPDFLLLDDFETSKTKDSEAHTDQVKKHIDEFKAGLDGRAKILYLGNYITEYGSVQALMDRAKRDNRLRIRMIPVIENGKPTWPSKYVMTNKEATGTNKISLEDKKVQLGSQAFNMEMMNQPINEETQEFTKDMFQSIKMEEVRSKNTRCYVTIDTAVSERDEADFTGITINYVDEQNKWNLKARKYKIGPKALFDLLFLIYKQDHPEKIGIEKGTYKKAIKPFLDDECRKRNVFLPIIELDHQETAKHTRIRGLLPRYETKSVFHIEGECDDLEEEFVRFPHSSHDDVMDSAAYQLQIAEAPIGDFAEQVRINENRHERMENEYV